VPQSLFARTALLIGGTIMVFSIIAWQAIVWTAIEPAAELAVPLLTQRAQAAISARRGGQPPPEGTRFETVAPTTMEPRLRGFAFRAYVETIRTKLQANLRASEIRIHRLAGPSEIWLRTPEAPDAWLVLSWRIADPKAPFAALGLLGAAALLALGGAAFSARRLTAPLAALAAAAARLAEGDRVEVDTGSGPKEVRSLAVAFQSMTHRLTEHDQQRELMLGGISHDLRTPLARLRVAVELLDNADPALTAEVTANIEEMDRMVGQFLHYVRANYHESPARASLDDIVRQTLAIYATDDRLQLELGAGEMRWFAENCIRQVSLNLVQNALDYGEPPVTVRTSLTNSEIQIRVHDCGAGLSESEWSEAVRPFHRLRDQPSGGHTGLGLAMVERLVRVCGGHLEAKQIASGFAVTVRFPTQTT
jgi:two-component system, OmpR family, osmolarity sensor histidine kinase EnvZ